MKSYPVLDPVSQAYPRVRGRSPTCYSPVRRSCTPERALPLDLHVLSTPPAFVLSQDQTLQQNPDKKNKNKTGTKPEKQARHTVEFSKDTRTPSPAARQAPGLIILVAPKLHRGNSSKVHGLQGLFNPSGQRRQPYTAGPAG